jgi:hypothetical protein
MSTRKRDPDIMAIDHAIRAIKKSTPRMLRPNIELVIFILQRIAREGL